MRIAIVGSRDFSRLDKIGDFVRDLPRDTVIVSGGARGVDTAAAAAARARGLEVVVYLPDWKKFGQSAGFLRNETIVQDSDEIVAFWNGRSNGTRHSIGLARRNGKRVRIFDEK